MVHESPRWPMGTQGVHGFHGDPWGRIGAHGHSWGSMGVPDPWAPMGTHGVALSDADHAVSLGVAGVALVKPCEPFVFIRFSAMENPIISRRSNFRFLEPRKPRSAEPSLIFTSSAYNK